MFKHLLGKLTSRYRKMSIQRVISLSFTAVTVVGMLLMGLTLSWRFSSSTDQTMLDSGQRLLSQVNMNLDNYLRQMMRVSDTMYYRGIKGIDTDSNLQNHLSFMYEANRDAVVSIAVFNSGGGLVAATPLTTLKPNANPTRQDWFVTAMDRVENFHFSLPHVQNLFEDPDNNFKWVVSLSRQVELTHQGVTESGVLLVDMSFAGMAQIFQDVSLPNGGYLYLVGNDGEIIYHPQQQLIYAGLAQENHQAVPGYQDGAHKESFGGSRRQVLVKTVGYTGWKLVGVVPAGSLQSNAGQLLLFGVAWVLFTVFLMAYLNVRISAYISDPIRKLERAVKELESGKKDVEFVEDGCYEVEHLSHSIRSMVSTMHHLMDDIIVQEEQKRRSELEVLQSQINPHFLYNTLDSVIWMTEAGRYDEAIQMVTSLARLFRISLSKGKSIIPLADELEHARHYLNIQEIRYKNKFTTQITAQDDVLGLYSLKLIVQPLLENAIYHGLSAGVDEGLIAIDARREGDDVLIDVRDNGIGMPPAVAQSLLQQSPPKSLKGSGIGVYNVHQRIRLTFGSAYGLTVISEPDEGTTVRIRLPVLTQPQAAPLPAKEGP